MVSDLNFRLEDWVNQNLRDIISAAKCNTLQDIPSSCFKSIQVLKLLSENLLPRFRTTLWCLSPPL